MISIIIPTYNEAENIEELLKKIKINLKKKHEIIIVDDNSPDKTADVVLKLKKQHPVRLIKRKRKLGLSSAVIDGFMIAKGDIIGVMDADLSHPADKIPELIKAIEKDDYDLAIGSRHIKDGDIEDWPYCRKIISRLASLLAKPLTKIKDPMSGFFFLKKETIKGVNLNPLGYKILLEVLVKGKQKKIKEIPITFKNRKKGKSKIGAKIYLDYIRQTFNLYKFKFLN